jgi:hypothetical protein
MRVFGTFGAAVLQYGWSKIKSWAVQWCALLKAGILSSFMAPPLTTLVQAAKDPHPITCHRRAWNAVWGIDTEYLRSIWISGPKIDPGIYLPYPDISRYLSGFFVRYLRYS